MLSEFRARWKICKAYTIAMAEAMPEEHFDFRPTPEQMSFGQQFTHLGYFNVFFFGFVNDHTGTLGEMTSGEAIRSVKHCIAEPEAANKENTIVYLEETFDRCTAFLSEMTEHDLAANQYQDRPPWLSGHSNRDLVLRAALHTAHHRGQAVIYLRLKGVTPPSFAQYNQW